MSQDHLCIQTMSGRPCTASLFDPESRETVIHALGCGDSKKPVRVPLLVAQFAYDERHPGSCLVRTADLHVAMRDRILDGVPPHQPGDVFMHEWFHSYSGTAGPTFSKSSLPVATDNLLISGFSLSARARDVETIEGAIADIRRASARQLRHFIGIGVGALINEFAPISRDPVSKSLSMFTKLIEENRFSSFFYKIFPHPFFASTVDRSNIAIPEFLLSPFRSHQTEMFLKRLQHYMKTTPDTALKGIYLIAQHAPRAVEKGDDAMAA